MDDVMWRPGERVSILGPRFRVFTLSEVSLDETVETWAGSADRTAHVWKPSMPTRDYLRGLIRHCNSRETFVFGIWSFTENRMVGYRKVQLVEEDHGRGVEHTAIPTSVIGDEFAGKSYGREAGNQNNWFLIRFAGVTAVSARIYEANEKTCRLVERLGYRLSRTSQERSPAGKSQTIRHYVITAEELEQKCGSFYQELQLEGIK